MFYKNCHSCLSIHMYKISHKEYIVIAHEDLAELFYLGCSFFVPELNKMVQN